MVLANVCGTSYYLNKVTKSVWDNIKDGKLSKHDDDRVYIVDGRERSGKSVWAIQQAAYIDPTIIEDGTKGEILPRITFTVEETLKAIRETKSTNKETKCIIFDEAFRGLSSKSALSQTNKKLVQAMMEMGQNNLVLFIVTPSFFLLEMYPAILRSNCLFHISKAKHSNLRYFRMYNYKKKAMIYQIGIRKGWGYPQKTGIKDHFPNKYPGGKSLEARYRLKKYKSLNEMYVEPENNELSANKWEKRAVSLMIWINKELKQSLHTIEDAFKRYDCPLSYDSIQKMTANRKKADIIEQKIDEKKQYLDKRMVELLKDMEIKPEIVV